MLNVMIRYGKIHCAIKPHLSSTSSDAKCRPLYKTEQAPISVPNPFFVVSEVTRSRPRVQSMLNVRFYPPHPVFWAPAIKRLRVLLYVIQILQLSDFVPA